MNPGWAYSLYCWSPQAALRTKQAQSNVWLTFCDLLLSGHLISKQMLQCCVCGTFKSRVEQIFTTRAQESVAVNQIQSAQEQMIRVHQIITDHWEVSCRTEENFFLIKRINNNNNIWGLRWWFCKLWHSTVNTFLVLVGTYFGMNMFPLLKWNNPVKRITVKSWVQ